MQYFIRNTLYTLIWGVKKAVNQLLGCPKVIMMIDLRDAVIAA